jgi:hypothetical protein
MASSLPNWWVAASSGVPSARTTASGTGGSCAPSRGGPEVITECYTHLTKDDAYEAMMQALTARNG